MTYQEFLVKLSETPRDWLVCAAGGIRRIGGTYPSIQCPISALQNEEFCFWRVTATQVGLSLRLAVRIVRAADARSTHRIRLDLLAACGVKELGQ